MQPTAQRRQQEVAIDRFARSPPYSAAEALARVLCAICWTARRALQPDGAQVRLQVAQAQGYGVDRGRRWPRPHTRNNRRGWAKVLSRAGHKARRARPGMVIDAALARAPTTRSAADTSQSWGHAREGALVRAKPSPNSDRTGRTSVLCRVPTG